jgi:putative SOS response-associated peptidase YedK
MCFSMQVDRDLKRLAQRFQAEIDGAAYECFKYLQGQYPKIFKDPDPEGRIFPNVFAPVMVAEKTASDACRRLIRPMRYRLRPADTASEVPAKYNVFNARLDSLLTRDTWSHIFGRQHVIVPFLRFFEWVPGVQGKKKLMGFWPQEKEIMWAAGLYDSWQDPRSEINFQSFAVITDNAPETIARQGHDRCPVFLAEKYFDDWLNPSGASNKILALLKNQEMVSWQHEWA